MPDTLAHYALSYLVASRMVKPRYAVLFAPIGLLPDVDTVLRIHRWITHSLVFVAIIVLVGAIILNYYSPRHLEYILLATGLYVLHIITDVFTAATPILWPITNQAYMFRIEIDGVITNHSVNIEPQIELITKNADFTPKPVLEGPLITPVGIIVAVGTIAIIIIEIMKENIVFKKQ